MTVPGLIYILASLAIPMHMITVSLATAECVHVNFYTKPEGVKSPKDRGLILYQSEGVGEMAWQPP